MFIRSKYINMAGSVSGVVSTTPVIPTSATVVAVSDEDRTRSHHGSERNCNTGHNTKKSNFEDKKKK